MFHVLSLFVIISLSMQISNELTDAHPTVVVNFDAGPMGLSYNTSNGKVVEVKPNMQAEKLKIQAGWKIIFINDVDYTRELVQEIIHQEKDYKITFLTVDDSLQTLLESSKYRYSLREKALCLQDLQGDWTMNFEDISFTVKGTSITKGGRRDGNLKETFESFKRQIKSDEYVLNKGPMDSTTLRWQHPDASMEDMLWYSIKKKNSPPYPQKYGIITTDESSKHITLQDLQGDWATNLPGGLTVKGKSLFVTGHEYLEDLEETDEAFKSRDYVLKKNSTTLRWKHISGYQDKTDMLWYGIKKTSAQPEKHGITNTQTLHVFSENITLQDLEGDWTVDLSYLGLGSVTVEIGGGTTDPFGYLYWEKKYYSDRGVKYKAYEIMNVDPKCFDIPRDALWVLNTNSPTLTWNKWPPTSETMLWYKKEKKSLFSCCCPGKKETITYKTK